MNPDLKEAEILAKKAGLRITRPRSGIFNLFRNTIPKLTFVGQRVNERALLDLVRKVARVE